MYKNRKIFSLCDELKHGCVLTGELSCEQPVALDEDVSQVDILRIARCEHLLEAFGTKAFVPDFELGHIGWVAFRESVRFFLPLIGAAEVTDEMDSEFGNFFKICIGEFVEVVGAVEEIPLHFTPVFGEVSPQIAEVYCSFKEYMSLGHVVGHSFVEVWRVGASSCNQ